MIRSQDLPITAPPLWPALPVSFVVDGSPRGLPAPPRQLYEAQQAKSWKKVLGTNVNFFRNVR